MDENRYGEWEGDFFNLPRQLIKKGVLNSADKETVKDFEITLKQYDMSYAYSIEEIFAVVYCYEGSCGAYPDRDIAQLDVYFDDNRVHLTYPPEHEGGEGEEISIEVDSYFLDYISEMMSENGRELRPPETEVDFTTWVESNNEDFFRAISLQLASENLTEEQQEMLSHVREAVDEEMSLMVLVAEDSVNCVITLAEEITVTLNVSLQNGGIAVLMYGDAFETFKVSEDYLQFVKEMLSNYQQGGIFYMGDKPPEMEVCHIEDDALAKQIISRITAYKELEELYDFSKAFLKEYDSYPTRCLMLYPKGFQILCFTVSNEAKQFFAYSDGFLVASLDGEQLLFNGEPFLKADLAYVDEIRSLLAPHGIRFE